MAKNIKFNSNKEAIDLLDNLKGSIENKVRTAYNLGYKDGLVDGKIEAIRSVHSWLFENDHKDEQSGKE